MRKRIILPQTPTIRSEMAPPIPGQQVRKVAGQAPMVKLANKPTKSSSVPVYLNHLIRLPSMSKLFQEETSMACILHLCPRVAAKISMRMPKINDRQAAIVPIALAKWPPSFSPDYSLNERSTLYFNITLTVT